MALAPRATLRASRLVYSSVAAQRLQGWTDSNKQVLTQAQPYGTAHITVYGVSVTRVQRTPKTPARSAPLACCPAVLLRCCCCGCLA